MSKAFSLEPITSLESLNNIKRYNALNRTHQLTFKDIVIEDHSFKNYDFAESHFRNCTFKNCDFRFSKFNIGSADHCIFENCNFSDLDFQRFSFESVHFLKSIFINSNLRNSVRNSTFEKCNFKKSFHKKCDFENTSFLGSDLSNAKFRSCTLHNTLWQDVILNPKTSFEICNFDARDRQHNVLNDKSDLIKFSSPFQRWNWKLISKIGRLPALEFSWTLFAFCLLLLSLIVFLNETRFIKDGILDYPIPIPHQLNWLTVGSFLLSIGTFLYRFYCPERIQNFTENQWVEGYGHARVLYRQFCIKNIISLTVTSAFLFVGLSIITWLTLSRIDYVLIHIPLTLILLDYSYFLFHLLLTAFNVFGWISKRTRRVHRWCVVITAACWVTVGPVFYSTFGYCPLTDWHWRVKHLRGETDLPNSFIAYLFRQVGLAPDPALVDIGVGVTFGVVILITFFLWLRERRHKLAA